KKPALREAQRGLARTPQMLLVNHRRFPEMPALFERRSGGFQVAKKLGKNIRRAAIAPELEFTIGQFAVTQDQLLAQLGGNVPKIRRRPAAQMAEIELGSFAHQAPAGRGQSTMMCLVQGDRMAQ